MTTEENSCHKKVEFYTPLYREIWVGEHPTDILIEKKKIKTKNKPLTIDWSEESFKII